ncbi:MAG: tetratricopeptide repeat protein [Streptomyces sp.]|nr:tetratricopeptide repeat protein [Streptomyces sp.]NUS88181.1 tetratricopeptide repeat protein [Streptomyces sp.]
MTDERTRREKRLRGALAPTGWTKSAERAMARTDANGTTWHCTLEPAEDDGAPETLRLEIRGAGRSFSADYVLDVRGTADPAGFFDGPVDRLGELLGVIAGLQTAVTGRTLTDKVLMPLLVRTAVFTGRFGVPLRTSGFHRERLPHPVSAPLPRAVAAALAAPHDGTRWLDAAFAALDADFPHLALTALDRALAAGADPAVPELWRAWLLRSVDTAEALAALDRAATAGGGVTGLARCLQGTIHQLGGDAERALEAWERATLEDPDDPYGWGVRGLTLAKRGRTADAAGVLADAVARHPGDATLQYYLGYARTLLGDAEGAFDALEEAIRLRPPLAGEILPDPDLAGLRDHERFASLTSARAADNGQEAEVTESLRRLATAVASQGAQRAKDWRRARLITYVGGDTLVGGEEEGGIDVSYTAAQGTERDLNVDLKALRPLVHALERSLPDEATAVELDVHAAGWFEALTAPGVRGSHRRNQTVHVLGRPGDPCGDPGDVPGGPDDPTEAGDPAEARRLLRDYLRRRAEITGAEETLPAPDPERADRLASLAREYGTALPADLRALYDIADGDGDLGLLDGFEWFTVSELEDHLVNRWWTVDIHENAWIDGAVSDGGPHAAVRRSHDRPGWIPFAYGSSLDYLAVDLDPAENGRPGQVIRIGTRRPHAEYVADSMTSLLRGHVEALRQGRFTDEDGWLTIDLAGMGREDGHGGACHVRGTLGDADIDERTLTLDARANGDLDLTAVRNAPLLREARLLCGSADLTPLNDVPVRTLDLDLRALDLSPLAGHPTLRTLTLKAPHAVDLTPLLTAGHLNGLDLSQATVRDITVLGGLRRLRHLSLSYEQWQQLWAEGVTPPALTVAILDGDHAPSTRADWLNQFTTARQYIGAFPTTGG